MTQILSRLRLSGRVAVIAIALGAATLGVAPVQAQSAPSFSFQLGIGKGGDVQAFGGSKSRGFTAIKSCLSNRQVERGLRSFGFRDVNVVRSIGKNRVLVIAEHGRRTYSMKVNKCTGAVYDVERLRARDRFPDRWRDDDGFPGFGMRFQFGH
ncbi:MAG: hypothetical protein IPK28_08700 [Devosia sp.]|nr:hypothetical protein [Devosia sp.]